MKDQHFHIVHKEYESRWGDIENGCLHVEANTYFEDYAPERQWFLTKEDTDKLFSIMTLEEFIKFASAANWEEIEDMFEKHGIEPEIFIF